MFSKYFIIVTDRSTDNFVTCLSYEDANEAIVAYYDYVERDLYDVVLYRRFKHDYVNI